MIILIGLDLDLVDLIVSEYPREKIGYVDLIDHGLDVVYLGNDDMIDRLTLDKDNYFVFGTDRSEVKSRILEAESLNTISIIARNILPKSFIDLGHGCVIQRLCYVSTTAKIGSYVKINVGAQVHHEALVGDLSTIAPMSCLLGKVMVGQKSFIGAGSLILPGIKIGNNCLVAAGSVVTRDVPDNYRVKGNPAKTF